MGPGVWAWADNDIGLIRSELAIRLVGQFGVAEDPVSDTDSVPISRVVGMNPRYTPTPLIIPQPSADPVSQTVVTAVTVPKKYV